MKTFQRILILLLLFAPSAFPQDAIQYLLHYAGGTDIRARVTITLPTARPGPLALVMPRAIPMGYGMQHYDRFIENVRAFDAGGNPLKVERTDGPRWQLGEGNAGVQRVEYEVNFQRMELEVLAGGDSSRRRFGYIQLLGYSAFAFIDGTESSPIAVEVSVGSVPVFSTLAPAVPLAKGTLRAKAADFYALADSQLLFGVNAQVVAVEGTRPPLYVAIYSEAEEVDQARILQMAKEAYERLIAYFGAAPFPHYTAIFDFLKPLTPEHRYGFSMEHLESATFVLPPERALTPKSTERDATLFRYNIAHHMAHAWIPKRAYGQGYYPFSWEVPPAHDSIWFSEGFGQYAAHDALTDGEPPDQRAAYFERVMELRYRATLREMPAFLLEMPLVELSRRGSYVYSEDFRVGRTLFSRGALMAEEMDKRIRAQSNGVKRLRDALRHLVAWTARNKRAFKIQELPAIFREATGVETRDILEKWLGPYRAGPN